MGVSNEVIEFIKQSLLPEISEIKSDLALVASGTGFRRCRILSLLPRET